MAKSKNKVSALVEQTAKMLRQAVASPKKKGKKIGLGIGNRIEQIALLLRSESKKRKKKY